MEAANDQDRQVPVVDSPQVFGEDVYCQVGSDHVAIVEIRRPPNNFLDLHLVASLADCYEALDVMEDCRAIVLCSQGRHFCAGANFGDPSSETAQSDSRPGRHLYDEAARLLATRKPVVAAIQGAAVGGGLGLALSADFRVVAPEARLTANFARLGFHHGFGLSATLPPVVGQQRAMELLLTGRRIGGREAFDIGLCDRIAELDQVRAEANRLAREIAESAPAAVQTIRETIRGDIAARFVAATQREKSIQQEQFGTDDVQEGIKASLERRAPRFTGS